MNQTNELKVTVISEGVRVKNAVLMFKESEDKFILQHYDTIVLEVIKGEVTLIKPNISLSTTRAIQQAFNYIGISESPSDYKKRTDLGANEGSRYGKYEISNNIRMNKRQVAKEFAGEQ